jgi:hypothetical protein
MSQTITFERIGGVGTYRSQSGVVVDFYVTKDVMAYEHGNRRYLIPYELKKIGQQVVRTIYVSGATLEGSTTLVADSVIQELLENLKAAAKAADTRCRFE